MGETHPPDAQRFLVAHKMPRGAFMRPLVDSHSEIVNFMSHRYRITFRETTPQLSTQTRYHITFRETTPHLSTQTRYHITFRETTPHLSTQTRYHITFREKTPHLSTQARFTFRETTPHLSTQARYHITFREKTPHLSTRTRFTFRFTFNPPPPGPGETTVPMAVGSWEEQYDQTATDGLPVPFLFSESNCLLWTCGQEPNLSSQTPGNQRLTCPEGPMAVPGLLPAPDWRRPETDPNPNPNPLSCPEGRMAVPGLLPAPEGLAEEDRISND
ncbi:unnamed protein product [Boreogadus saida]